MSEDTQQEIEDTEIIFDTCAQVEETQPRETMPAAPPQTPAEPVDVEDAEESQPAEEPQPADTQEDIEQDQYTQEDIERTLIVMEKMKELLPRNKYVVPLLEDIDFLQIECTLICTAPAPGNNNEPENTSTANLLDRMNKAMAKYDEIKRLVDNIMSASRHLKRHASDPPQGSEEAQKAPRV